MMEMLLNTKMTKLKLQFKKIVIQKGCWVENLR